MSEPIRAPQDSMLTDLHARRSARRCCNGRSTSAAGILCLGLLVLPSGAAAQEKPIPWWEAETAMSDSGELLLSKKPWWPRAQALKPGEHLVVRSGYPGGALMLVRREHLVRRDRTEVDAIVWVLDDDGDLRPGDPDGDKDNDCYVVDYDGDGRADRMVDYIDNDGDGKPDEMEIRYFLDGRLRRAWFGVDLDKDGQMWDLIAYEYSGDFFRSDPYGNNLLYANEYDPGRKRWVPHSECPFAFYDTDGDGESEVVIRVSAVPLGFDRQKEPDYANSVFHYTGPFTERMRDVGAMNVRYSVDIDGLSSPQRRLHYDLGFNMIGRVPYRFPGMAHESRLRRAPKTTLCIPHADLRQLADSYPAEQTGFSFREYWDSAVILGAPSFAHEGRRWEGVFWIWNRRIMHNTGGPTQEWNMRREFRPTPSTKRELYYCRADRRIHLKGASEGWLRVGHLSNREPWGEIRFFDTNGDGYFDRWEVHLAGSSGPARVSAVLDAGIRELPQDWDQLQKLYTQELLPEALQANKKLMAAMRGLQDFTAPEPLAKALEAATCDSERCYVQDVLRETQYLALRDQLGKRSSELLQDPSGKDPRLDPQRMAASTRAWEYARLVSSLDAAYGEGRYDDAVRILGALQRGEGKSSGTQESKKE